MPTIPGGVRRVLAFLLSLATPGAGHFLFGAFRRGVAWAAGTAALGFALGFVISLNFLTVVAAVALPALAHIASALDTLRLRAPRPPWKILIAAWVGLLVGWVVLQEPLGRNARSHAQAFTVPSGAMEPTLLVGDYVMTDKARYLEGVPRRGDIIVFKYPLDERRDFIKRIVGLPGERIVVRGHRVDVNGQLLEEPYLEGRIASLADGRSCVYAFGCDTTSVPAESYFVMGDNRDNSQDSRHWGFVRRDRIVGRAFTVYWSWDRDRTSPRLDRIGRAL
jgi:signal peptidase I